MSSSPKSNAASPSSPPTGSAADPADAEDADADDADDDESEDGDESEDDEQAAVFKPVEVALEVSRQRSVTWVVAGTAMGILLILKLGTVGVWVGIALCLVAALHAIALAQSLMNEPGTISVTATSVTLPRGLCKGKPLQLAPGDVTAAYFLRRSVPWNKSSPVLIVEVGPRALVFPRDWFANEADQRHVIHALLRGQKSLPAKS